MEASVPEEQHQVLEPCSGCYLSEFHVSNLVGRFQTDGERKQVADEHKPAMLIITSFVSRQLVQFAAGGRVVQDSVAYSAECYQVSLDVATKGAAPSQVVNI
jgi:hypothetical protein